MTKETKKVLRQLLIKTINSDRKGQKNHKMTKVRHLPIPELRIFKRVPIQFLFGFLPPSPRSFTTLYLVPFTFTDGLQKDEHLRPINKQFPVYFAIQSRPQW